MSFQIQGGKKKETGIWRADFHKAFYSSYKTVIYSSTCYLPLQQLVLPGGIWLLMWSVFTSEKRKMLKLNYAAHEENSRVIIDICKETLSF